MKKKIRKVLEILTLFVKQATNQVKRKRSIKRGGNVQNVFN